MNKKELLNSIQKYLFYAVDLNLYLDNHPECKEAKDDYNTISSNLDCLVKDYEKAYGPLLSFGFAHSENPKKWIETPWPWENC